MKRKITTETKLNFEDLTFEPNRQLTVVAPLISKKDEKFCFKDGFYFNEDQSIILKSSFVFGKIFKPV